MACATSCHRHSLAGWRSMCMRSVSWCCSGYGGGESLGAFADRLEWFSVHFHLRFLFLERFLLHDRHGSWTISGWLFHGFAIPDTHLHGFLFAVGYGAACSWHSRRSWRTGRQVDTCPRFCFFSISRLNTRLHRTTSRSPQQLHQQFLSCNSFLIPRYPKSLFSTQELNAFSLSTRV